MNNAIKQRTPRLVRRQSDTLVSTLSRGKPCTWGSGVRCNDGVSIISPTTHGGR